MSPAPEVDLRVGGTVEGFDMEGRRVTYQFTRVAPWVCPLALLVAWLPQKLSIRLLALIVATGTDFLTFDERAA
jgi:hypothetical protein